MLVYSGSSEGRKPGGSVALRSPRTSPFFQAWLADDGFVCGFAQWLEGSVAMVNVCANPDCGKPLHYLREGKIFVFQIPNPGASDEIPRHLEHFWLCGDCSGSRTLVQDSTGAVRSIRKLPDILEPGGKEKYVTGTSL
jgi:hypothetical protein